MIKIDVEGTELQELRGARELLRLRVFRALLGLHPDSVAQFSPLLSAGKAAPPHAK